jgi:hypothetical protein
VNAGARKSPSTASQVTPSPAYPGRGDPSLSSAGRNSILNGAGLGLRTSRRSVTRQARTVPHADPRDFSRNAARRRGGAKSPTRMRASRQRVSGSRRFESLRVRHRLGCAKSLVLDRCGPTLGRACLALPAIRNEDRICYKESSERVTVTIACAAALSGIHSVASEKSPTARRPAFGFRRTARARP